MKLEVDINWSDLEYEKPNGQVSIKLPKDQEKRFKDLNKTYCRKLSRLTRKFVLQLMDAVEAEWPKDSEQEAS